MLFERVRQFWETLQSSPREVFEASQYPDLDDLQIKHPQGDQVLKFTKAGDVSLFSGPNSGIRLYGGENIATYEGSALFTNDLHAMAGFSWGLQAMNPLLKLPTTQFLVLTPQVQAALTGVLNNPTAGGVPGTIVAGLPVFLPSASMAVFSSKALEVLGSLGIKLPGGGS